jgi:hypothetical protein
MNMTAKLPFDRSVLSGLLGIGLLMPAGYFLLSLVLRLCFGTAWYYSMAPSFLQSPFNLFAWHKAQFILDCLLLAILLNGLVLLRVRWQRNPEGWRLGIGFKKYWLNTAVALQSSLFLLALLAYTLIQHIRY